MGSLYVWSADDVRANRTPDSRPAHRGRFLMWRLLPLVVVAWSVGCQGETGLRGAQGAQGPEGSPGLDGERGPQGATGPQGPEGAAGERGPSGTSAAARTLLAIRQKIEDAGTSTGCVFSSGTSDGVSPDPDCCPPGFDAIGVHSSGGLEAACLEAEPSGRGVARVHSVAEGSCTSLADPSVCCPEAFDAVGMGGQGTIVCLEG